MSGGTPRDPRAERGVRLTRGVPPGWDPSAAAVVVCDMWDAHHCAAADRRVAEMAPRMNAVLAGLRARGALVVHAPDGCMDAYRGTPARRRAVRAPFAPAPHRIASTGRAGSPTNVPRCR